MGGVQRSDAFCVPKVMFPEHQGRWQVLPHNIMFTDEKLIPEKSNNASVEVTGPV